MWNNFAVRVRVARRNGDLVVIERGFPTEAKRTRWIEKRETQDDFIEVVAYADPRPRLQEVSK